MSLSFQSNPTIKIDTGTFSGSAVIIGTTSATVTFTTSTTGAFSAVASSDGWRTLPSIIVGDLGDVEEIILIPEPAQVPDYPPAETPIVTEPEKVPVPA